MEAIIKRRHVLIFEKSAVLGLALIGLAACDSGDPTPTTGTPAPGGSAGFSGPLAFIK